MHTSLWEQESFFKRRDVVIIGGGLAGLWSAYELLSKNPSLQLLILDKEIIPYGASTRNAGFACFGSPTELIHDSQKMGEERMWELTEMRYRGIQKIREIFDDKIIDYDDCGGYECLNSNKNNIEKIVADLDWLNEGLKSITGKENTFILATEKLAEQGFHEQGFQGFAALIENKLEGGLHSGKLVIALQEKIRSLGGQIMQGIGVNKWEEDNNEVVIFAQQNITIKATKVLICTNALSKHLLPNINLTAARGQVVVTTPINDLRMRGTFHYDGGFYYFRNVDNRVLLGGARNTAFEEEETTSFDTTTGIQETLEHFLRTHILPKQSYAIEYKWSGIMGFTDDKQPLVQAITNRVTAIVICNGMGVAISPMIAEQIDL